MTAVMSYQRNEPVLRVDHVTTRLGGKSVLRDVSFEIRNVTRPGMTTGQIIAILGLSGVGKTRLLRVVAGLDRPDGGSVTLGANARPVRAGAVGMVFQSYPLFEHRTLLANLRMMTSNRQRIDELLERFRLARCIHRYPSQLSGGERQRAALLQQILCGHGLLLLDEPLSGLDPAAVDEVCSLLKEIASLDDLNTLIMTTHNIEPALAIADTVLLLGAEPGVEGATIRKCYDLIEAGITWHPTLETSHEFLELKREIRMDLSRL
jgi:ABC-type nitrate/sulfonate/bicarbonate transport system ATPase subunit